MFNCRLCIEESGGGDGQQSLTQFPTLDQLEAHLAADHFGLLPYECEQCQFAKFPTEFAVMKHNEQDHGNRSYSFRCRITPEVKLKRYRVREFLMNITESVPARHTNQMPSLIPIVGQRGPIKTQRQNLKRTTASPRLLSNKFAQSSNSSNAKASPHNPLLTIKKEMVELDDDNELQKQQKKAGLDETLFNQAYQLDGEVSPATLTEQIQAACIQNMRRGESTGTASGRLRPSYGGTLEIREGADLTATLLNNAANDDSGDGEEGVGEEAGDGGQQADVQEILKAAAEAVSLVGGGNRQTPPTRNSGNKNTNGGYSLRPNRFSPYALLHNGFPTQPYQFGDGARGSKALTQFHGDLKREKMVDRIQCRKCHEMVNAQGGCLNHHTNTRHLRLPMFQCTICNKDFFEVSNTRIHKHMRIHHAGDTSHLISNYHKHSAALHAARDECFGRKEERNQAMMRNTTGGRIISNTKYIPKQQQQKRRVNFGFNTSTGSCNNRAAADPCATVSAVLHSEKAQNKMEMELGEAMNEEMMAPKQRKTGRGQQQMEAGEEQEGEEHGANFDEQAMDILGEDEGDEHQQQEGEHENEEVMNDDHERSDVINELGEEDEEEEEEEGAICEDELPAPMISMKKEQSNNFAGQGGKEVEEEVEEEEIDDEEEIEEEEEEVEMGGGGEGEVGAEMEVLSYPTGQQQQNNQQNGKTPTSSYRNRGGNGGASSSETSYQEKAAGSNTVYQQQQQNMQSPIANQTPQQKQFHAGQQSKSSHPKDQFYYHQQQIGFPSTEEKVPCKACGEMVWNKITNRLNHVNARHLHLPLHECALCHKSFTSYSRSACYSHVQFAHKAEIESGQCSSVIEEHIVYKKERYNGQLMEAANGYF